MTSAIKDKITESFTLLWQSVKSFFRNNNFSVAASLAYYSLFAMIPLLLLLFFSLSLFLTSSKVIIQRITMLMSQFIPYHSDAILKEVYALARHKGIWGVLSMAALLWALTPLMSNLRTAFFDIFKVEERPSFLKIKLLDISVILLILSLLVGVSFSGVIFKKFLILEGTNALYNIASYFVTAIIMAIFYLVFTPVTVSFCYIFTGSIVTTLLWGIIRPVFGLFLSYNPHYGIAFGSLKALFIIILWIYYSFSVLLFGTEMIANLRRKDILLLRGLFYETYTDKKTTKLKRMFGKEYGAGEVIFEEGEKGSEMFYVIAGSVRLIRKGQIIKLMRKGEYFGEMALLIGTPRTASANAEENNTIVISITPDNFEGILREEPKIAILFLKELANRLKDTDKMLR
ncbi:MAG: YihY family inner membrane protein [Nitrospirae bacterium]|nr:YihY family inner membrane protein [Nitrospirota bacterium]